MNSIRRIQSVFDAAEGEGGRAPPVSGAKTATSAVFRAQAPRQKESRPTLPRSWTAPPSPGSRRPRRISKSSLKSTRNESPRTLQKPTGVTPGNGEILIAVMGASGSGKSYFCRAATGDDGVGFGDRPGSRNAADTTPEIYLLIDFQVNRKQPGTN